MGTCRSVTISVPFRAPGPRFPPVEATKPKTRPSAAKATTVSADERRAEIERRLDEAADVLAETLIDMWRGEQRGKLDAARGGPS